MQPEYALIARDRRQPYRLNAPPPSTPTHTKASWHARRRGRARRHAAARSFELADAIAAGANVGTYGAPTGDIVILAVPHSGTGSVVADLGEALAGKIVIDIAGPVAAAVTRRGGSGGAGNGKTPPTSAHTMFGHVLAKGGRLDAYFAADDAGQGARVDLPRWLRQLNVGGLHMAHTLKTLDLIMIGLVENGAGSWDIAMNVETG
jgi:predicted dinucleotide-binding enzyme